ncbi:sugar transferase [uncultured Cetobacterium sp.]
MDDAKKKLEFDIYYIKYQNIAMDIIILFKTVKVVLFGKGM